MQAELVRSPVRGQEQEQTDVSPRLANCTEYLKHTMFQPELGLHQVCFKHTWDHVWMLLKVNRLSTYVQSLASAIISVFNRIIKGDREEVWSQMIGNSNKNDVCQVYK